MRANRAAPQYDRSRRSWAGVRSNGTTTARVGYPSVAPVQAAVNALIADGVYYQILAKWGLQNGAVTTASVNGAIR